LQIPFCSAIYLITVRARKIIRPINMCGCAVLQEEIEKIRRVDLRRFQSLIVHRFREIYQTCLPQIVMANELPNFELTDFGIYELKN